MGFGDFISNAAKAASEIALNSASSVCNWTAEQARHAYQTGQQAVGWVGEKAEQVKEWGVENAKGGVADGLGAAKASPAIVRSIKEFTGQKVQSVTGPIVKAVDKVFGRKGATPSAPPEYPVQPCPLSEALRKQETRAVRQALVSKGEKSSESAVREKAAELKRDMDAVEDANLSNHIYCIHDSRDCTAENSVVPGFKDVSNDTKALSAIGLNPHDLGIPNSNFRAAVFQRESPPFAPEEVGYVVVFKGTSPASVEDWQNDFRQGLNADSPYYKQAIKIGQKVSDGVGDPADSKVSFAGHSLGGGLASAAANASGLPANTFNAAGLNPATVARYGGQSHDSVEVRAYHVPGDPLTDLQEKGMGPIQPPRAAGEPDTVDRALQDQAIPKGEDDAYFHSMPVVIRALERRKGADEERLRSATGS